MFTTEVLFQFSVISWMKGENSNQINKKIYIVKIKINQNDTQICNHAWKNAKIIVLTLYGFLHVQNFDL